MSEAPMWCVNDEGGLALMEPNIPWPAWSWAVICYAIVLIFVMGFLNGCESEAPKDLKAGWFWRLFTPWLWPVLLVGMIADGAWYWFKDWQDERHRRRQEWRRRR